MESRYHPKLLKLARQLVKALATNKIKKAIQIEKALKTTINNKAKKIKTKQIQQMAQEGFFIVEKVAESKARNTEFTDKKIILHCVCEVLYETIFIKGLYCSKPFNRKLPPLAVVIQTNSELDYQRVVKIIETLLACMKHLNKFFFVAETNCKFSIANFFQVSFGSDTQINLGFAKLLNSSEENPFALKTIKFLCEKLEQSMNMDNRSDILNYMVKSLYCISSDAAMCKPILHLINDILFKATDINKNNLLTFDMALVLIEHHDDINLKYRIWDFVQTYLTPTEIKTLYYHCQTIKDPEIRDEIFKFLFKIKPAPASTLVNNLRLFVPVEKLVKMPDKKSEKPHEIQLPGVVEEVKHVVRVNALSQKRSL